MSSVRENTRQYTLVPSHGAIELRACARTLQPNCNSAPHTHIATNKQTRQVTGKQANRMAKCIVNEVKAITRIAKKIVTKPSSTAHRKLLMQELELYEQIGSFKGDLDEAKLRPLIVKMGLAIGEAEEAVKKAQCITLKKYLRPATKPSGQANETAPPPPPPPAPSPAPTPTPAPLPTPAPTIEATQKRVAQKKDHHRKRREGKQP